MSNQTKEYIALLLISTTIYALAIMWIYDGESLNSDKKGGICLFYLFAVVIPISFSHFVLKPEKL